MKNKILLTAFCLSVISLTYGQDSTFRKGYLRVRSYGNSFSRIGGDTALHIPLKTSLTLNDNDLSPQIFVKDSVLYYTVGNVYKVASSGAGSSFSGHYSDLTGTPTIPSVTAGTNTSVTYSGGVYTINSSGGGSYVAPSSYTFTSTGSATITLPYAYVTNSVSVYENGILQTTPFTQTSSTVITLGYTPFSGTTFNITYTRQ